MDQVKVTSPTRVDLAGGTLDLWPLYNFVGGASTINVAIDIWTSCEIIKLTTKEIRITSSDLNQTWSFNNTTELLASPIQALDFYQSILRHFSDSIAQLPFGFELITSSQSPIGGGLGGSSSLVISVLKALHQFFNLSLPDTNALVHLAHNIEAEMLQTPTGKQDYFPAVTGGISVIDFNAQGVKQTIQTVEGTPLKDHFLLVYTGRSHHSGLNNFEVFKSAVKGDPKVMDALKKIRDIANQLKQVMVDQRWSELPELFRQEYDARIQLTPAFTSPEIEKLHDIGLKAGATAVKICGAGGGGCVLVWVAPENRQRVIDACVAADFKCLPAKPVEPL